MDAKSEGALFPPLPLPRVRAREAVRGGIPAREGDLPCEICGAPVLAASCRRVCLTCGFMTGCPVRV
jgi:hypothetical protein